MKSIVMNNSGLWVSQAYTVTKYRKFTIRNQETETLLDRTLLTNDPFHPMDEDIGEALGNKDAFDTAMDIVKNEMTAEEQMIIRDFMDERPQWQTANELNVSQAKVSKTLKNAMTKLSMKMQARGYTEL